MKNEKKALTLVELLVWITISILLMVSVWIILSSGIKNIFLQEKSISNSLEINDFYNEILEAMSNFSGNLEEKWNWIIFKRETEFDKWGFSFIWTKNFDYCKNWETNKKLFIKNFIPNSDFVFWDFKSHTKENFISENEEKIIWTDIFWENFKNWEKWENIALNWPTWMILIWNNLYFSDSLNNRILYYNTKNQKVYSFLSKEDWLDLPTKLTFSDNILKINNSRNEKNLIFEIKEENDYNQNIDFAKNSFYDFDKIEINYKKIWKNAEEYNDFSIKNIENISLWENNFYFEKNEENKKIVYKTDNLENFYDFKIEKTNINTETPENSNEELREKLKKIMENYFKKNWRQVSNILVLWYSVKDEILVRIRFYEMKNNKEFQNNFSYKISNITEKRFHFPEIENFWENFWEIYWQINFLKDDKIVLSFPEKKLFSKTFEFKEEEEEEESEKNNFSNLNFYENNDKSLALPIESIDFSTENWFLTIIVKYYKNYDCENLDSNKEKIKTIFFKKKIS